MDVRLSAPDLFVERSVRSAWRTAEGVGDLLMTDAADRQVLLGRWSQSRRVDAAGWGKSRIATVKRPLNHLRALQTRNFVRDDFAFYGILPQSRLGSLERVKKMKPASSSSPPQR